MLSLEQKLVKVKKVTPVEEFKGDKRDYGCSVRIEWLGDNTTLDTLDKHLRLAFYERENGKPRVEPSGQEGMPLPRVEVTDDEGCTTADARMLRAANHALAAENDALRRALRPFANIVSTDRLSWAMVEYCVEGDPEKQASQRPQMQRAFNRAADLLRENVPSETPTDNDEIDAERYRWLRKQYWHESSLFVVAGSKSRIQLGTDCPADDRLDAAIDAARAGEGHADQA
ncbi:hypothetical protein [Burkholderia sp. HI2500]|uniref:hypothetical protein n=1 Tax=Burkholderia sp. HI2500 TaxID=2015358 RepID=UPI000B7AB9A9|nr:hypothetical protein [Burkholderia sp. HI2500]OXJ16301.1 hypothetical protein CFB45_06970 [Burkholderia sp. HI2500]